MEKIESVGDFVEAILDRSPNSSTISTFRGHGSTEFRLQPSIFRTSTNRRNEHILLRELIAAHPEEFSSDTSALEILVRMQHYSLPTRLLDVSLNPLVALFFGCESTKKRIQRTVGERKISRSIEMDGHVVILTIPKRCVRYFDSDTVSCLANVARLSWQYKQEIDTGLEMNDFNESTPVKRLLHFIRQERNGFIPEIVPADLDSIVLVKPKQNNRRILAQAGAFFVFGLATEIKDRNAERIKVERIAIEAEAKKDILDQLDRLGINEKTLFPEIERAARYITGSMSSGRVTSAIL